MIILYWGAGNACYNWPCFIQSNAYSLKLSVESNFVVSIPHVHSPLNVLVLIVYLSVSLKYIPL